MSSNPRVEEVDGGVELHQTFTELFRRVARTTADISGSGPVFLIMLTVVIVWAISGPYFRFSDTWQLVINTGTSVMTFLMVFLIQNTQNRDTLEMRLKLDELIRSHKAASNAFIHLDHLPDAALKEIEQKLIELRQQRSRVAEVEKGT